MRTLIGPTRAFLALLLAVACGGDTGDGDLFGDGGSGAAPGDDGTGDGEDGEDGSGDDGSDGAGDDGDDTKYDVAEGDGGPGDGMGCDKVDFLFIVDDSQSMEHVQSQLVASFPGFIDSIRSTVQASDYHIMVTDTDACIGDVLGIPGNCGATACDNELGAGVTFPVGNNASGVDCGIADAKRWMTASQPDLEGTFACAARVGTSGYGDEKPMGSLMQTIAPALNGSGACNDGFLRDDAILVVSILSDAIPNTAFELGTAGPAPQSWYDQLVAAKGGNADAIVVLGVLSHTKPGQPTCLVAGGLQSEAQRLIDFVDLFADKGFVESVCESDFSPFFQAAVETIDLTCDEFVPEG